jgi:hypothetical protein
MQAREPRVRGRLRHNRRNLVSVLRASDGAARGSVESMTRTVLSGDFGSSALTRGKSVTWRVWCVSTIFFVTSKHFSPSCIPLGFIEFPVYDRKISAALRRPRRSVCPHEHTSRSDAHADALPPLRSAPVHEGQGDVCAHAKVQLVRRFVACWFIQKAGMTQINTHLQHKRALEDTRLVGP